MVANIKYKMEKQHMWFFKSITFINTRNVKLDKAKKE